MYHPNRQGGQIGLEPQKDASSRAPLGTINVVLTAPSRTSSHPSKVMSMARPLAMDFGHEPKRSRMEIEPALSFLNEDKVGTIQPHDDALVVTLRIGGMM